MKKIISICILTAAFAGLQAQKNLNLENWSNLTGSQIPTDWDNYNIFFDEGYADSVSVIKTTDAYSGYYAAKIRPIMANFGQPILLPGSMYQIYASTAKPMSFRFAYKYTTPNSDLALAALYFYKGAISDTNNIIGRAYMFLSPKSTYTYMVLPITWTSSNSPDTATLNFMVGANGLNSWLTVDDVSLSSFSAGSSDIASTPMKVFVDGSKNLNIQGIESDQTLINLYDAMGKMVQSYPLQSGTTTLTIADIKSGIYFYEIMGKVSKVTGKIMLD